jgi:hypothetical protein
MLKNIGFGCLIAFIGMSLCTCKKGYMDRFGPFYILNDTTVVINGDMGSRVDNQFEKFVNKYPNIKLLIMEECPGSRNDEELFKAAAMLKENSINTHLPPYAIIESGAVDLFLAGTIRTMEEGAKIGVHAWSNGSSSATDYPEGHEEHEIYIDYYISVGYSQQDAEALYYFIINAASPDNIHYLTEQEIIDYNILTP